MRADPSAGPGRVSLSIDPSKSKRKEEYKKQWRKLDTTKTANVHGKKASSPTKTKPSSEKRRQEQGAVRSRSANATKSSSPNKTKRASSTKQRQEPDAARSSNVRVEKATTSPTKAKRTTEEQKQQQGTSTARSNTTHIKKPSNPAKTARSEENQRLGHSAARLSSANVKKSSSRTKTIRTSEKKIQEQGAARSSNAHARKSSNPMKAEHTVEKLAPSKQEPKPTETKRKTKDIQVVESRSPPEMRNEGDELRENGEKYSPLMYIVDGSHWNKQGVPASDGICEANCLEEFSITDQTLIKEAFHQDNPEVIGEKAPNEAKVKNLTLRSTQLKKLVLESSNAFQRYAEQAATGINEMIVLGRNGCNAKDFMECISEWDGNTSYGSFTNDSDPMESDLSMSQSTAVQDVEVPMGNDEGNEVESHFKEMPRSNSSTSDNDTIVTEAPSTVRGFSDQKIESYFSSPIGCADLLPVESDSFSVLSPGSQTVGSVESHVSSKRPSSPKKNGSVGILPVKSSSSSVRSQSSLPSILPPADSCDDEELSRIQETIQDVQHFEVQLSTSSLSRLDNQSVETDKDSVAKQKKASGLKSLLALAKKEEEEEGGLNQETENNSPNVQDAHDVEALKTNPKDQEELLTNGSLDIGNDANRDDLTMPLEERIVQVKDDKAAEEKNEGSRTTTKNSATDESNVNQSTAVKTVCADPINRLAVQDLKNMQDDALDSKVEYDEIQGNETTAEPNDDMASISTRELRRAERKAFAISLKPLKGTKSCNSYLSTSESCSDESNKSLDLKKNEVDSCHKQVGKGLILDDATNVTQPKVSPEAYNSEKNETSDLMGQHINQKPSVKHRLPKQSSVMAPFTKDGIDAKSSVMTPATPQVKRTKVSLIKSFFRKAKK